MNYTVERLEIKLIINKNLFIKLHVKVSQRLHLFQLLLGNNRKGGCFYIISLSHREVRDKKSNLIWASF